MLRGVIFGLELGETYKGALEKVMNPVELNVVVPVVAVTSGVVLSGIKDDGGDAWADGEIIGESGREFTDSTDKVITQAEMNMYESGNMAPAAYTYLMNLIYRYYLSDNQSGKDYYTKLIKEFRENNYKTTNGLFPDVDANILTMSSKPSALMSREQHYFRNKLNIEFEWYVFQKLQSKLPEYLKWRQLSGSESVYHQNTAPNKDNRKYVSKCSHFEMVFNNKNELLNEKTCDIDMGTYNFYGPDKPIEHFTYDVTPYYSWENTQNQYNIKGRKLLPSVPTGVPTIGQNISNLLK